MTTRNTRSFLHGKGWTAHQVDNTYIVSIQDKFSILEALTDFVTARNIESGEITGIGAVNEATLRFFDPEAKKYVNKTFNEQMEVSNISGNISEVEGKPALHMHVTLGRSDYTSLAGHLFDAKIRGAGEFFIYPLNSHVVKVENEEIGVNFYHFKNE